MIHRDPWADLRQFTSARIALGRAGAGLPTAPMLDFQAAHAQARDAVWTPFDAGAVKQALGEEEAILVESQAKDRAQYLQRPDLGRLLAPRSVDQLPQDTGADLAFVLADGLSATAAQAHGPAFLKIVKTLMAGRTIAPTVIATQARVGLSDEIGQGLGVRLVVMLIGERPGLSAADSLGAYLTFAPQTGRQNAERNCLSNIRPGGLPFDTAARRLAWLIDESLRLKTSGLDLKDRSEGVLGEETPHKIPL